MNILEQFNPAPKMPEQEIAEAEKKAIIRSLERALAESNAIESRAIESAAFKAAAMVMAYRHLGIHCGAYLLTDMDSPFGLHSEANPIAPYSAMQTRVAKLTAIFAISRYNMTPGVKELILDAGMVLRDLKHPTIENEVLEAVELVYDKWPAIIAEWQKVKVEARVNGPA
jgi:hypothetical protein